MKTRGLFQNDAPARIASQTGQSHRILVADDEPIMQQLYASVLAPSGYQVEAAKDGAAAWEALCANKYDLLITDNSMPKVSGVELIEKLRAARMSLPTILVSGSLPTENPSLKISVTLLKPVSPDALLKNVKEVLRTPRTDDCSWPLHGEAGSRSDPPQ
jgi:CheY-like chemotaxis protein